VNMRWPIRRWMKLHLIFQMIFNVFIYYMEPPFSNTDLTTILSEKEALNNNGQCSSIYTDKTKKYIIKEISLTRYQTFDNILKEIEIQKKAFELDVAPQLHDYKKEGDKVYIIMEKLKEFRDLTTVYNEEIKNMTEDMKKKIANAIATAITILYTEGIYHLDLHSDNIFIDTSNNVKIIDYGLSEFFKEGSNENTTRKQPYKHQVIEIIGSDDYLDLTKYIKKDENTPTQGGKTRRIIKKKTKKNNKNKKNKKKRKTKNKTTNYKRKTIKRVKRKQI
jgi:serine/threonine protein kinase